MIDLIKDNIPFAIGAGAAGIYIVLKLLSDIGEHLQENKHLHKHEHWVMMDGVKVEVNESFMLVCRKNNGDTLTQDEMDMHNRHLFQNKIRPR